MSGTFNTVGEEEGGSGTVVWGQSWSETPGDFPSSKAGLRCTSGTATPRFRSAIIVVISLSTLIRSASVGGSCLRCGRSLMSQALPSSQPISSDSASPYPTALSGGVNPGDGGEQV